MLEKDIEKAVCEYAKSRKIEAYKFSSPNRAGVPDRMFLAPFQHAFWIEFKKPGGKPTPLQVRECERIRYMGFDVYLVDSVEEGKAVIDGELEVATAKIQAYLMGKAIIDEREQSESTGETRH